MQPLGRRSGGGESPAAGFACWLVAAALPEQPSLQGRNIIDVLNPFLDALGAAEEPLEERLVFYWVDVSSSFPPGRAGSRAAALHRDEFNTPSQDV